MGLESGVGPKESNADRRIQEMAACYRLAAAAALPARPLSSDCPMWQTATRRARRRALQRAGRGVGCWSASSQDRKHQVLTVEINPPGLYRLYHHFLGWWVLGGWVNEKNKFVNSNGQWLFVGNDLLITCRFTKS